MEVTQGNQTVLNLYDKYGRVPSTMTLVLASSGYGKSLAEETIVEANHDAGKVIIVLSDVKDKKEYGFAMFEPVEKYHLDDLKLISKPIKTRDVKFYHPFTFNLPKHPIPPTTFYTFSLKELDRSDFSMIAETPSESEVIRLMLNASQNISKNDGIYSYLHYIQDTVRGKMSKKEIKPDPKNFYLSATQATMKALQDIGSFFQPFKQDYFLSADNSELKIDWKSILSDNSCYHVFLSNYIKDKKMKEFLIMCLFNKILENQEYATKPILIVIPEIRHLCPFYPEGYKIFLADSIKNNMSIMRNKGHGMGLVTDSQVYSDIDDDVANSATDILVGCLKGVGDADRFSKARNYKRELRDKLSNMDKR